MCMPNVGLRLPFTVRKEEGAGHNRMAPNTGVRYVLHTSSCTSICKIVCIRFCISENVLCCA